MKNLSRRQLLKNVIVATYVVAFGNLFSRTVDGSEESKLNQSNDTKLGIGSRTPTAALNITIGNQSYCIPIY